MSSNRGAQGRKGRTMQPAEKDKRRPANERRTAARKQANVAKNEAAALNNRAEVHRLGITPILTKQTVVTKDKEGHRITKVVEKLEKPSQAIRRYYREQGKQPGGSIIALDPQQANHPGRSTKATREAKAKREAAKAKDALTEFLTTVS